jgi:hypothetical protein
MSITGATVTTADIIDDSDDIDGGDVTLAEVNTQTWWSSGSTVQNWAFGASDPWFWDTNVNLPNLR